MIFERRHELFIAAKKDPQFGPIILFGTGGTKVEQFRDISVGFPPLNRVMARRLVESTAICKHALATGHPLNVRLLEEVLVKFSRMILDFPEIKEAEINPLILNEEDAVAVDARIVIEEQLHRGTSGHENYAIAPYPHEYVSDCKLKSGISVLLRPIIPEDEGRFSDFLRSLSEETMRFRFFSVFKEMSHERLVKYCNLDYDREIAIIAEPQGRVRQLIGAVRLAIEPDGKNGEFGIVIGDEWQGLGLGAKFMDLLIKVAKDKKLKQVHGFVLANNFKMLTLCYRKGFKSTSLDEYTVEVTLPLTYD
jgi:acetyltransferase